MYVCMVIQKKTEGDIERQRETDLIMLEETVSVFVNRFNQHISGDRETEIDSETE